MTQYQVTLNEQTLQQLFSGDSQLAQHLESILNEADTFIVRVNVYTKYLHLREKMSPVFSMIQGKTVMRMTPEAFHT